MAGPDIEEHLDQLRTYADAGYDEIYVANMGPHYLAMIEAYGSRGPARLQLHHVTED